MLVGERNGIGMRMKKEHCGMEGREGREGKEREGKGIEGKGVFRICLSCTHSVCIVYLLL